MESLFRLLAEIHPLSDALKQALQKKAVPLSLPKNYHLLEAPKICDHVYFVTTGFAMSYSFIDGDKTINGFARPGQFILAVNSFFERVPSLEYIQVMQKSEVLCISHAELQDLFSTFPEVNFITNIMLNRYSEHCRKRVRDMQQLTAAQRHEKFLHTFPGIEQIIPQDYIASYLGITPQSVSRIKRNKR